MRYREHWQIFARFYRCPGSFWIIKQFLDDVGQEIVEWYEYLSDIKDFYDYIREYENPEETDFFFEHFYHAFLSCSQSFSRTRTALYYYCLKRKINKTVIDETADTMANTIRIAKTTSATVIPMTNSEVMLLICLLLSMSAPSLCGKRRRGDVQRAWRASLTPPLSHRKAIRRSTAPGCCWRS